MNSRIGFRWNEGWVLSASSRNLLDKKYYEFLSAAPGNSGLMWDSLAINERSASLCNARSKHSEVTTATIPNTDFQERGQSRYLPNSSSMRSQYSSATRRLI